MNDETSNSGPIETGAPRFSVVVPVYNSQVSLENLCGRVRKVFEGRGESFEIILVDDCSRDDSWKVMERLHDEDSRIRVVQLMRNVGQFRAIMCGLGRVRGEFAITMDDDLQHPPEEIFVLIERITGDESVDGVIGIPLRKMHGVVRNAGSYILRRLNHCFFKLPKDLRMGSFRILRRRVVDLMVQNRSINVTIGPLLLSTTGRLANVTVDHHAREQGKTNYNPYRLLRTSLDNIMNYSTLPLSMLGICGLVMSAVSALFGAYAVGLNVFRGVGVPGWTSIVVLLCLFSGAILAALGFVGEYLIRIVREVSRESQYNVRIDRS